MPVFGTGFAGYQQHGRLGLGGFVRAVLRAGPQIVWQCEHEHDTRSGAMSCAYHAEHFARAAGFLPANLVCRWDDMRR